MGRLTGSTALWAYLRGKKRGSVRPPLAGGARAAAPKHRPPGLHCVGGQGAVRLATAARTTGPHRHAGSHQPHVRGRRGGVCSQHRRRGSNKRGGHRSQQRGRVRGDAIHRGRRHERGLKGPHLVRARTSGVGPLRPPHHPGRRPCSTAGARHSRSQKGSGSYEARRAEISGGRVATDSAF